MGFSHISLPLFVIFLYVSQSFPSIEGVCSSYQSDQSQVGLQVVLVGSVTDVVDSTSGVVIVGSVGVGVDCVVVVGSGVVVVGSGVGKVD